MERDTICYIKSDLKNKFSYFNFEKDTVFQRNKTDKNNNLVFILHGEMEVIYGDLYPKLISEGNMIFLTPLSQCVCKVVSTVELIILGLDTLNHSCDKYIFQNLTIIKKRTTSFCTLFSFQNVKFAFHCYFI